MAGVMGETKMALKVFQAIIVQVKSAWQSPGYPHSHQSLGGPPTRLPFARSIRRSKEMLWPTISASRQNWRNRGHPFAVLIVPFGHQEFIGQPVDSDGIAYTCRVSQVMMETLHLFAPGKPQGSQFNDFIPARVETRLSPHRE